MPHPVITWLTPVGSAEEAEVIAQRIPYRNHGTRS
jgi:hypothetical protein